MSKKSIAKFSHTLSEYLETKSFEYELSERQLSKLIMPNSSGSLIATIRFNESKLSEKKIMNIANFFKDDPILLTFMAGRIPIKVHEMIINNKEIQNYLIDMLERAK